MKWFLPICLLVGGCTTVKLSPMDDLEAVDALEQFYNQPGRTYEPSERLK